MDVTMTILSRFNTCLVLLLALGAAAAGAATPPFDWKLVVDVSPMTIFTHPTSEDRIRLLVRAESMPDCTILGFSPPVVTGHVIRLQGFRASSGILCTPGPWSEEFVLPDLLDPDNGTSVVYTLEVYDHELLIRSQPLEVFPPLESLHFGFAGGSSVVQFHLSVQLTDPRAGPPRQASAHQSMPGAGYFWFFDPENVEVTAKMVDGRPLNGHLWVFLTGMSNLGYSVTVRGEGCFPAPCRSKTYVNPPGQRLNVIDVSTF
jgi:hypothetical protein